MRKVYKVLLVGHLGSFGDDAVVEPTMVANCSLCGGGPRPFRKWRGQAPRRVETSW